MKNDIWETSIYLILSGITLALVTVWTCGYLDDLWGEHNWTHDPLMVTKGIFTVVSGILAMLGLLGLWAGAEENYNENKDSRDSDPEDAD